MSVIEYEVTDNIFCCPICASRPRRFYGVENHRFWIECDNPDCPVQPSTKHHLIKGMEIRDWNNGKFVD